MSRRAFIFGLIVIALLIIGLYRAKYGAREAVAEAERLGSEIVAAEEELALLQAELAHMSRREWIEEYARRELGMGPPRPEQFVSEAELERMLGGTPPAEAPE